MRTPKMVRCLLLLALVALAAAASPARMLLDEEKKPVQANAQDDASTQGHYKKHHDGYDGGDKHGYKRHNEDKYGSYGYYKDDTNGYDEHKEDKYSYGGPRDDYGGESDGYHGHHHGPELVDPPSHHAPYSIGLWGDLPYSVLQATTGITNLIADMNSHNLAFTVYDGDWKAGSPINTTTSNPANPAITLTCQDPLFYEEIPGWLNALNAPAIYAPGDNEWTDCDRNASGVAQSAVFNSLNRLSLIRKLYFNNNPKSFGKRQLRQEVQTDMCYGWNSGDPNSLEAGSGGYKLEPCSENRRWQYGGVTYVTINQVGSCNNRCKQNPDDKEWAQRNAANIKWVQESFAKAKLRNSVAIMIVSQADPGWNLATIPGFDSRRNPSNLILAGSDPDGFYDFMVMLRDETTAFKKPVAFVHGDSHQFTIDKPFYAWGITPDTPGQRLVNFTRIMTFGDNQEQGNNDMNWVKVNVEPRSQHVFSFTPMVVAANTPSQAV